MSSCGINQGVDDRSLLAVKAAIIIGFRNSNSIITAVSALLAGHVIMKLCTVAYKILSNRNKAGLCIVYMSFLLYILVVLCAVKYYCYYLLLKLFNSMSATISLPSITMV
jgi:hypothetical protein